jgi:hypothetical protein
MHVKARVTCQPGFDPGMFVGGVIVHDQMQLQLGRGLLVNLLEEAQPLAMGMAPIGAGNDLTLKIIAEQYRD